MIFKKSFLFFVVLIFVACGGGDSGSGTSSGIPSNSTIKVTLTKNSNKIISKSNDIVEEIIVDKELNDDIQVISENKIIDSGISNKSTVTISGRVTYDFVPFQSGGRTGLDYNSKVRKSVRGAVVEIINATGTTVGRTNTDGNGNYRISVTEDDVKVRVLAQLYKASSSGQSSWDFQVKDNTNSGALYAMEGSMSSLGSSSTQTRNLNASNGWGGNSYTGTRVAAPFAILDVVYAAIEKVTTAQNDALFGSLDIFWSENNIATAGNKNLGQIVTSHFDGIALYILGKENSDTDEYDTAVVGHEWGHYYEAKFSRSDSIGGAHGSGDMLDIRVAFGEGFGTALGCIIIDSPLYLDSSSRSQGSTGVFSNLENGGTHTNPGWYSEQSIYSIIYDIYDSNDDRGDTLSLGFTPIHNALIGAQKNSAAFTSIFPFIKILKDENSGDSTAIDAITSNESIAPINDIYGTGRTNRLVNANPLYSTLSVGGSIGIVTDYSATSTSSNNMLGRYNFVKFTISSAGTYTINLSQIAGSVPLDPDVILYKEGSSTPIAKVTNEGTTDSLVTSLTAGDYRMAVIVYN